MLLSSAGFKVRVTIFVDIVSELFSGIQGWKKSNAAYAPHAGFTLVEVTMCKGMKFRQNYGLRNELFGPECFAFLPLCKVSVRQNLLPTTGIP